jgi:HlyD family secretion protein
MVVLDFFRRHKKASIITGIILVVLVLPIWLLTRPKAAQYVTAAVEKGNLQQTVEAVGTVTSERDLELKFPNAGILSSVPVTEGDTVEVGQVLATLRSGNVAASVAMQSANLQSALADLRKLEEGTRPVDIAIAQATLQTAQDALAQAKDQLKAVQQEAVVTLAGEVDSARATISSQLVTAETALSAVNEVLSNVIVQNAITVSNPLDDMNIRALRQTALTSINDARGQASLATDSHTMLPALKTAQTSLYRTMSALDALYALLGTLQETGSYTAAVREEHRTTLSTQRGLVQTSQATVTSTYGDLQTTNATYETKIGTARTTITADEGAVQRAQADLASKTAGTREADLDASRARVRQAQAALAQAQSNYADTILRSPVKGTVTHVYAKTGEATPLSGPAITVLGNTPFRVEMNISEVDVPKLARSQSGTLELDAFPGVKYKVRVSEIDSSPTLVDGVSKYRVKLDFLYPHAEFKIGMTGDVTVVTGERTNVVNVPSRAVSTKESGEKTVRILSGDTPEERVITTGMEGESGNIEVTSGLQGGENVIVLQK